MRTGPDVVVLVCTAEWVREGRIDAALAVLRSMVASRAALAHYAGKLVLCFSGYDDDPRELDQIPEVAAWMRKLHARFPYWLVLCDRVSPTIPLILNLLHTGTAECDAVKGRTVRHAANAVRPTILSMLGHMAQLCEQLQVPPETALAWNLEALACLAAYLD